MSHKKLFKILTLAMFVAMVAISLLQAAPGCQKKDDSEKMMGKSCMMKSEGCMMLKQLPNLSDEQKGKLEKLNAEHQKMMTAAMADMEKLAGEMKALMKDPVDVKKAEAKIDEVAKMKADLQKKCLAHCLAVRALLTDEQKAKFDEMGCCGMGCGVMGSCRMHMKGGMMKHGMRMDHSKCQKAAEEKK
jgi:Spy/CpxP family protein refolding chaperone